MALSRRRWLTFAFLASALALYIYGIASASYVPIEIGAIALPLDFMVGMPLLFYLMVIRPRRLSLLYAIPMIWLGYGLSVLALESPDAGILPVLLAVLIPLELAIALLESGRIVRAFKDARVRSEDPLDWLYKAAYYLMRKEQPANMMAAELGVWYYALFSWRKKPSVDADAKVYSYHNAGGYMNMMLGFALAFPIEIIGAHLLLSQWSAMAATIVTMLSIYAGIWLLGDARARFLRPVILNDRELHIECGIQMHAVIPLCEIAQISASEPIGIDKADKLNCGTFYQANVWIVAKRPVAARTLTGTKRIRAIGLSLDGPGAFLCSWEELRSNDKWQQGQATLPLR